MAKKRNLRVISVCTLFGIAHSLVVAAETDQPLHIRIDAALMAQQTRPVAPLADDAEFLRRVSLDLIGSIPAAASARRFLADNAADKRLRLIDRLLYSREYADWMQTVFSVMLMERRSDKHVPSDQWQTYLRKSFAENKPYNQLVREILSADGSDPTLRGAAKFFLDRNGETTLLTRDVGRIFFGVDFQCAQCHDHPLIDDYEQSDYYSLNAFLSRSSIHEFQEVDYNAASGTVTFSPGTTEQVILVGVKGDKRDEPDETFVVNLSNAVNAVIVDGQGVGTILDDDNETLATPTVRSDRPPPTEVDQSDSRPRLSINDWKLKERDGGTDGLPFMVTLSRPSTETITVDFRTADETASDGRDKLATVQETADGQVTFSSVFEPDASHQAVPRLPGGLTISEPKLAADELYLIAPTASQRGVPRFSRRRALAHLATSGRSSAFNRNIANRLWALMMGRGLVQPLDLHHRDNPPDHPQLLDLLTDEFVQSGFDIRSFLREIALTDAYQRTTRSDVVSEQASAFSAGPLKPLTAEQLARSVLEATGATRTPSPADSSSQTGASPAAALSDQTASQQLEQQQQRIAKAFAVSGNQDFQATTQQALFLSNADEIRQLLQRTPGNLTDRLSEIDNPTEFAGELYLSIFSRFPSSDEAAEVIRYRERRLDRLSATQELIWALLTSLEFRFNH